MLLIVEIKILLYSPPSEKNARELNFILAN